MFILKRNRSLTYYRGDSKVLKMKTKDKHTRKTGRAINNAEIRSGICPFPSTSHKNDPRS